MDDIKKIEKGNVQYPSQIKEFNNAPPVLYYRGNLDAFTSICVAVIGKRDVELRDLQNAHIAGELLSKNGYTVVNGVARGCDQAALRGVIEAKGKAILVMPCGLDYIYPASARGIVNEILKYGGCLISEYPPETKPQKYMFLQRDRLQAAIADKVLIVNADEKGGTMTTAQYALRLNKPIACMAGMDRRIAGNILLTSSNKAKAVYNTTDVMKFVQESSFVQLSFV